MNIVHDLATLVEQLSFEVLRGEVDGEISSLVYDSRKVEDGCLFVCMKGAAFDSHSVISDVIARGARVVVVERDLAELGLVTEATESATDDATNDTINNGATNVDDAASNDSGSGAIVILKVADSREALAILSAAYFDHPAEKLKVIGITGTKGKTTTTYMVKSILENAGVRTGLVGTIEVIIGDKHIHANNTTPESYLLQEYFAEMVDENLDACVMEVSSQGLMMHRADGFLFELGVFTNLEPDHIGANEHSSFEDYAYWKSVLFQKCRVGIFNADDAHLDMILQNHTCAVETFGFSEDADLRASNVELINGAGYLGIKYDVTGLREATTTFEVDLPGKFSVYNSLCAIAICRHFHVSIETMQNALKNAKAKGRIEMIKVSDDFTLMIDYAHNAMALESLLTTLKQYNPKRLVCLFGCGGNRAKSRRFEMGEVSGNLADLSVITSDNPRFEEPQAIIDDIKVGIGKTNGKYVEIIDRKDAIRYVIENGQKGDVIVLAGKGHEDYQEIKGKKYPMDERVLIEEVLHEIGWK